MQFLHVFTTMQCAAMARVVFVKSVKQVLNSNSMVTGPGQNDAENNENYHAIEMTAINAEDTNRQDDGYQTQDRHREWLAETDQISYRWMKPSWWFI